MIITILIAAVRQLKINDNDRLDWKFVIDNNKSAIIASFSLHSNYASEQRVSKLFQKQSVQTTKIMHSTTRTSQPY
jgi:hypothetical protein